MVHRNSIIIVLSMCISLGCKDAKESEQNTGVDTGSETDSETTSAEAKWEISMVSQESAGIQTSLVTGPDDQLGLAYFANESFSDGICDEIATNPPTRLRQSLNFAFRDANVDQWQTEVVDSPVVSFGPTGLSLAFTPQGDPSIAFTGGIPEGQYCGGNDAVLATRQNGTWNFETASALSGESQTGIAISDTGIVVGLWPALSYDANGQPAIVHKDVHFGALQADDAKKTDAEFAWRQGGGWIHEAIDAGEGAGEYTALLFDGSTPVAFYGIPVETQQDSRQGVWAAKRGENGTWGERVQLHDGAIYQEIVAGINPVSQEIVVAFYSAEKNAVRLRRLATRETFSNESTWSSEIVGNSIYDEGQHVSLAFTSDGREVLAYHRCKRNTSTIDSCDQNDEAVVVAISTTTGWKYDVVANSQLGSCGEYTSIAIDTQDTVHVVYRCTVVDVDEFSFRLFIASKFIGGQT